MSTNEKLAATGIIGTVVYAIADLFLFLGADMYSEDKTQSFLAVPEWRLMASMWIAALGSLLMLFGYVSLYRLYKDVFKKKCLILMLPALTCFGAVMYMHFVLGVYEPLTYISAVKAGVEPDVAIKILSNATSYISPLTAVLIVLGYSTQIVLVYGLLSGRFGLKKRVAAYIYGGAVAIALLFILIARMTGEWGITGSLESLFEMTFFIPGLLYFRKAR